MKLNLLNVLLTIILSVVSIQTAFASAKAGEASVYAGNTTTISLASAYETTLRRATGVSARWYSENTSVVSVSSYNNYSAVVKGVSVTPTYSPCKVYYQCSYWIDGFYRTMDFYYEITVKSSTVYVTSVSLSQNSATLYEGDNLSLSASVYPSNATNRGVTWSSSNSTVASVSNSGYVTAKNAGSATITCRASDGGGCYDQCYVTVKSSTVYVTSVSLNTTSSTLNVGETLQLSASVYPSNATNRSVTWSSSNSSVATVSSSGYVTAKGTGSATITCKATDGSGKYATCSITVKEATVAVSSVTLNKSTASINEGETVQLSATISPSNASNKSVTWTSSNTAVATVSSNGLVTGKTVGSATITCKAADGSGKYATCNVTVNKKVEDVAGLEGTYYVTSSHETVASPTKSYTDGFDLVITKNSTGYWITSMFGEDLTTYNEGGFKLTNKGDNKFSADISDDCNILSYNSATGYLYAIYVVDEATDNWKNTWELTLDSNGNLEIEDFYVVAFTYNEEDEIWRGNIDALYYNLTGHKGTNPISNDQLQIADITSKSGGTAILPISLTNEEVISGFQFSLSLPEGVSVTDAEMSDRASKLTPSYNLSNGLYKFSVMSLNGKTVSGNDGVVMNVELQLASTIKEGTYSMTLKDIKLFTENGDEITVADNSAKLTVKNYMLGDVNNNGEVNTNDAIAIVNHVIGKTQSVFIEEAADVNGNGEINTNDAIAIVNYVIGKTNALKAKSRQNVEEAKTDNAITLDNVSAIAGEKVTLHVKMTNDFVASGFQFHLSLPEGVTIDCDDEDWDTTDRTKKFAVSGNLSDGVYKFSVMSLTGKTITGNEGDVLTINLKVDASVLPNDYPMTITNAILFEEGSTRDHRIADSSAILSIKSDDTPTIGDFSWVGSYTVTATVEVENGNSNEFPVTFNMEISEDADGGLKVSKFLLTDFIYDITGGLWLTDMEAASGKITVKDDLLGFAEGDADIMYQIKSYNNVEWPEYDWIGIHAVNENDIRIDDFIVERVLIDYYSDDIFSAPKVGARYSNVIAHKTDLAASLHTVNTAEAQLNMSIVGNSIHFGHKVPVKVYGMNGTLVRNTVADHVDALAKGLYIVKIGNYTKKVLIK